MREFLPIFMSAVDLSCVSYLLSKHLEAADRVEVLTLWLT